MAYATLSQLKDYLSIADASQDTMLTSILDRATAFIETYTARKFGQGIAIAVTDEEYDGLDTNVFFLKNTDIQSVTAVKVGNPSFSSFTTLTVQEYIWHKSGRIVLNSINFNRYDNTRFNSFAAGYQTIRMSYTYGLATVPTDIEQACLEIAVLIYMGRASAGIRKETIGSYMIEYKDIQDILQQNSPLVLRILQAQKMRRL